MPEQIYKQHHHRKHSDEMAPLVELPAGGPDDNTSELHNDTTQLLDKIAHVLGEISVRPD
jgi:hypothetical protein